jgi:hypothetical protein
MTPSARYFAAFALRNLSAFRPHVRAGATLGKRAGVWWTVGRALAEGIGYAGPVESLPLHLDRLLRSRTLA